MQVFILFYSGVDEKAHKHISTTQIYIHVSFRTLKDVKSQIEKLNMQSISLFWFYKCGKPCNDPAHDGRLGSEV